MPEGDTIHKTAASLGRALIGKRVARFEVPRLSRAIARPGAGATITGVEARGKHLLIHFDGGFALHTHMGMPGAWHLYRAGERWRRPAHLVRARVDTDDGMVAVCFNAPTVEVLRERDGAGGEVARAVPHPQLDALGPDLCDEHPDIDEVLRRLSLLEPTTEIANALLNQRAASGIGNVYKSEALFACRVNPFTTLDRIDDSTRRDIVVTASNQLRANLGGGPRTTVPGGGLAVYGRANRPCRVCATPIRARRQGEHARTSYWCPRCQTPSA